MRKRAHHKHHWHCVLERCCYKLLNRVQLCLYAEADALGIDWEVLCYRALDHLQGTTTTRGSTLSQLQQTVPAAHSPQLHGGSNNLHLVGCMQRALPLQAPAAHAAVGNLDNSCRLFAHRPSPTSVSAKSMRMQPQPALWTSAHLEQFVRSVCCSYAELLQQLHHQTLEAGEGTRDAHLGVHLHATAAVREGIACSEQIANCMPVQPTCSDLLASTSRPGT